LPGVGSDDDPSLGAKVGNSDTVGVAIAVGLFEDGGATAGSLVVGRNVEGYFVGSCVSNTDGALLGLVVMSVEAELGAELGTCDGELDDEFFVGKENGSRLGCMEGFMDIVVGWWEGFLDGAKDASELGDSDGAPEDEGGMPTDDVGSMLGSDDGLSDKEGFIDGPELGFLDLDGDMLDTEDGSADVDVSDGAPDDEGFTEGPELGIIDLDGVMLGTEDADFEGDKLGSSVGFVVGSGVAAIGDNVGGGLGGGAATE